jgi:ElaB/YqjD/DUF883 family membrane-anchored ribosome-binding protein
MKLNHQIPSRSTRNALDRVLGDLRSLVADSETLLEATAGDASTAATDARAKIREALAQAKETYEDLQDRAITSVREAAETTDTTIRANPYKSLGIALGVGFLIGLVARGGGGRSSD